MKQTVSVSLAIMCLMLFGCANPRWAQEISPQEFFTLRMENQYSGKSLKGWLIIDDKSEFVLIGYTSKLAHSDEQKWLKYKKCNKEELTSSFPAFRNLDGIEIRRRILEVIKPIQKEQIDAVVKRNGSGGMRQAFEWTYDLTTSNILVEVVWDYTVFHPAKQYHYEFTCSLTNEYEPKIVVKDKNSNKALERNYEPLRDS